MKAVLDACVLFPTVLREVLTEVAARGLFQPLWSPRLIGEWVQAVRKLGPDQSAQAGAEAALLNLRFPAAALPDRGEAGLGIDLPDPADLQVVATALDGGARLIVTMNLRDFPQRALSPLGLRALHPDEFLTGFVQDHHMIVAQAVQNTLDRARAAGGTLSRQDMLRRARLPRLNKALERRDTDKGRD